MEFTPLNRSLLVVAIASLTLICVICVLNLRLQMNNVQLNDETFDFSKFNLTLNDFPSSTNNRSSVRVAMFGDSGLQMPAIEVLRMIRRWRADFVLHAGDFDYVDSPYLFKRLINEELGSTFPYFGVVGNHDVPMWSEYKQDLITRLQQTNMTRNCRGDYGVNMVCRVNGVLFVLSGVGTLGAGHEQFMEAALKANKDVRWKICVWHKNQRAYQLGRKADETGYAVYDICRKHGALILTGHEHSYARTHPMKSFERMQMANSRNLNLTNLVRIKQGQTIAFVSGIGGREPRPWANEARMNSWWAAVGAQQTGIKQGALLCEFRLGNSSMAKCKFRDYEDTIWDDFTLVSQ